MLRGRPLLPSEVRFVPTQKHIGYSLALVDGAPALSPGEVFRPLTPGWMRCARSFNRIRKQQLLRQNFFSRMLRITRPLVATTDGVPPEPWAPTVQGRKASPEPPANAVAIDGPIAQVCSSTSFTALREDHRRPDQSALVRAVKALQRSDPAADNTWTIACKCHYQRAQANAIIFAELIWRFFQHHLNLAKQHGIPPQS